jgi:hypothetical protein
VNRTDLILGYLDIWNERDSGVRKELSKSVLTDDAIYSDPDYAGLRGQDALSAAIDKLHGNIGDLRFTLGEVIGTHHDRALFTWRLGTVASGYDFVEFTEDRSRLVVGFFS